MMARPHEERTARLEGAYEQVADRLNSLDRNVGELRREMHDGFARADERLDAKFGALDMKFGGLFGVLDAKIDSQAVSLRSEMQATTRLLITAMTGQTALIIGAVVAVALAMHR